MGPSKPTSMIASHYRHQRLPTLFIPPTALFLLLLCQAPSRVRPDCYDCSDTRSKSPIQSTSFTDGSPAYSLYSNNVDCCWLIQPGYNGIQLSFSRFQTEPYSDTVRIYDGPSTSSALIATYSGSSIPDSVSTNGGSLLVRFTSDFSVTDRGFAASYQQHYGELTSASSSSNCAFIALFNFSGFVSISDVAYISLDSDVLVCSLIQPSYTGIQLNMNYQSLFGLDVLSFYSSSTVRNSAYIGTVTYNETRRSGAQDDRMVIRSPTDDLLIATRLPYSDLSYDWSLFFSAIERSYSRDTGTGCTSRTTLTADSGSFTDGSAADDLYFSFLSCSWLIAPSNGGPVRLTFQNLDTEPIDDEVRVYDGPETSSPLIGAFSGSSRPTDTITSTNSSLLVTFVTDGLGSGRGFDVSYSTLMDGNNGMDDDSMSLQNCDDDGSNRSPIETTYFTDGSPPNSDYSNNVDKCWLIQPGYSGIELSFSRFQTERHHDTVRLYDGPSTASPLIATYSGSSIPDSVSTNGESLLVRFTTDGSVVDRGFAASYQRHYGEPTSTSYSSNCGAIALFDSSGFVSISEDPDIPPYRDALVCCHIQPGYSGIRLDSSYYSLFELNVLSFYSSSTIRSSAYIGTVTYNDTVRPGTMDNRIVIRSPTSDLFIATRLSYSHLPYIWSTLVSAIERSYSRYTGTGCEERATLTADSGSFTDGSAADDLYPAFLSCSWLIAPSSGQQIRLTFQYLDTEQNYDEVRVYDGSETSSPLIGAFSQFNRPTDTITSTGSSLLVTFVTDGLGSGLGFSISYETLSPSDSDSPATVHTPLVEGDTERKEVGLEGRVALEGMPGVADVREQRKAFREAIARVAGEEVDPEQVKIVGVVKCGGGDEWWNEGCTEVTFQVTGIISKEEAIAELVADRIREAAASPPSDSRSLASALRSFSGVSGVTVSDFEATVLEINDDSPLTLGLILGVTLGAVAIFGSVVLLLHLQRSRLGMKNRIFSVSEETPAGAVPASLADSTQEPPAHGNDTPLEQEESNSLT